MPAPTARVLGVTIGTEKEVAVPFSAVKHAMKDDKVYLTMDASKDALKAAPRLKYEKETISRISDRPSKRK